MNGLLRGFKHSLPLLAVVAVASGCGGGRPGDVSGTVRYNSKPLATGSVVLVGSDGVPRTGSIGTDGKYSISGVPSGEVKVAVVSELPAANSIKKTSSDGKDNKPQRTGDKGTAAKTPPPAGWFEIPKRYSDVTSSSLTIVIVPGSNDKDISLTD